MNIRLGSSASWCNTFKGVATSIAAGEPFGSWDDVLDRNRQQAVAGYVLLKAKTGIRGMKQVVGEEKVLPISQRVISPPRAPQRLRDFAVGVGLITDVCQGKDM